MNRIPIHNIFQIMRINFNSILRLSELLFFKRRLSLCFLNLVARLTCSKVSEERRIITTSSE
jgi:hypothetical protein